MAASTYTSSQYLAGNFVVSAGSVLFRHSPTNVLEICLLYETKKKEYLLPKGRKDLGESIEAAAVRETFEETGYPCKLWPQRMPTRATVPGVSSQDTTQVADGLVEPIAVTIRDLGEKGAKLIWWFITIVEKGAEKIPGTQTETETFESIFLEAKRAVEWLKFQGDRDIAIQALDIVNGGAI